jgi:hypothetical protein
MGGQGADRGRAAYARVGAGRPGRARQGLPHRPPRSLGASVRQPAHAAGPAGLSHPEPVVLPVRPGREALPGEGRRSSLRAEDAVPLVPGLPGGRALAPLVTPLLPVERPRLRSQPQGRSRDRLAAALRGPRALVRPCAGLHRHQRREGRTPPAPRGRPAATLRDELLRAGPAAEHRDVVPRPEPDHEPRGGADAAPQRARRLPGPQPVPPRLSLRRVLLEQFFDPSRRRGHGTADSLSPFHRRQPDRRPRNGPGQRRARDRRGDGEGGRVLRPPRLPECVHPGNHGTAPPLDLGPHMGTTP